MDLFVRQERTPTRDQVVEIGHELADEYLTFLGGRARPNTVVATAFDLKVFLSWAARETKAPSPGLLHFPVHAFGKLPRCSADSLAVT
jgi:hypothetical protein